VAAIRSSPDHVSAMTNSVAISAVHCGWLIRHAAIRSHAPMTPCAKPSSMKSGTSESVS